MTTTQTWIQTATLAALLATPALAQGDDCSTASAIAGAGNWAFDTTAATTTGFSGASACTNAGSLDVGPDQFFQWTVDAAGSWQIDTCGSAYDTKLNAHAGSACAAICTAYNDDGPCGSFHSTLILTGVAIGDTFLIQVGGFAGTSGIGVLNTVPLGAPGANDDCSVADVIGGFGIWTFNTVGASISGFSGGSACTAAGSLDLGPDLFWQWTATTSSDVEIKLEGSLYDTKLNVHTGTACAATCVAYNDDAYGLDSAVTLTGVSVGDTFVIQIGGYGGNSGLGTLTIDLPPPTPNDDCSTATAISDLGTWAFDTSGATSSAFGGGGSCYTDINRDIFYQWTTTTSGDFTIDTEGSLFDTKINVHTGVGCAATCLAWDDDSGTLLLSKVVVQGLSAGDTLLIQVGGFGTMLGAGFLNVATWVDPCLANPPDAFAPNHSCAAAAAINDGTYSLTVCKTEPDFFSLTVPAGGTLTIDALFSTAIADLDAMLYEAIFCDDNQTSACGGTLACGYSGSDNENLLWTNTTGVDVNCILRVHVWPNTGGDTNTYDLIVAGAGSSGPALFCNPANAHSGSGFATLGTSNVSGPGLFHLEATDGPIDQFGYFLVSAGSMDPGVSVSQGQLCLMAPIGRYSPAAGGTLNSIGRFDAAGVLQALAGNSSVGSGYDVPAALPSPPGGVIVMGATWHFQLWYRDGAASNFSDGISVTF